MVDALGEGGDEGRGQAAKSCGEVLATCDPQISEWGNPTRIKFVLSHCKTMRGDTRGSETSQYPEEKKKIFIP